MSDDFGDAFSIRTLQDNVALAHDLPASDHARYRSENSSLFPYCNLWNQNLAPAGLRWSNWDVANPEGSDHDLGTHLATCQRDDVAKGRSEQCSTFPAAWLHRECRSRRTSKMERARDYSGFHEAVSPAVVARLRQRILSSRCEVEHTIIEVC